MYHNSNLNNLDFGKLKYWNFVKAGTFWALTGLTFWMPISYLLLVKTSLKNKDILTDFKNLPPEKRTKSRGIWVAFLVSKFIFFFFHLGGKRDLSLKDGDEGGERIEIINEV